MTKVLFYCLLLLIVALFIVGIRFAMKKKTEEKETKNSSTEAIKTYLELEDFDAFFLAINDEHCNETVRSFDNLVRFVSGFTGSQGFVFLTRTGPNYLFVDSRYYLQAEREIDSAEWKMLKVETDVEKFFAERTQWRVFFDPTSTSLSAHSKLKARFVVFQASVFVRNTVDFVAFVTEQKKSFATDHLFFNRNNEVYKTAFPRLFELPEETVGESAASKLLRVRNAFAEDFLLVSDLTQLAWLLNLRGFDYPTVPTFDAFLLLGPQTGTLFVDPAKLSQPVSASLSAVSIQTAPCVDFCKHLAQLTGKRVLARPNTLVYAVYEALEKAGAQFVEMTTDFLAQMVAIKNSTEVARVAAVHRRDSLRFLRFWQLFEQRAVDPAFSAFSEFDLAMLMETVRDADPFYFSPAYTSIVAAGPNGAVVHYSPSKTTAAPVFRPASLVLVDSGGQYTDGGTTDVTRVFLVGEPAPVFILHYTAVLRATIAALLPSRSFVPEEAAAQIDQLCRDRVAEVGQSYGHGTGHGIGAFLNVHESPVSINKGFTFVPGLVSSIEPGIYVENSHGIRLENAVLSSQLETDNTKLVFKALTLIPYERKLIDVAQLTEEERNYLNSYYSQVLQLVEENNDYDEEFKIFVAKKCKPL